MEELLSEEIYEAMETPPNSNLIQTVGTTGIYAFGDRVRRVDKIVTIDELGIQPL